MPISLTWGFVHLLKHFSMLMRPTSGSSFCMFCDYFLWAMSNVRNNLELDFTENVLG